MTEKQEAALRKLQANQHGIGNISVGHLKFFVANGLVERTGDSSGARGEVHVRLTSLGKGEI
jgi:hypothetical protein